MIDAQHSQQLEQTIESAQTSDLQQQIRRCYLKSVLDMFTCYMPDSITFWYYPDVRNVTCEITIIDSANKTQHDYSCVCSIDSAAFESVVADGIKDAFVFLRREAPEFFKMS